jgi:RNA polymerase sigma factor (sigma-70 family)
MTERLHFSGRSHVTGRSNGAARGTDGHLDIKLPAPHLAAEQLFAAAWSASVPGVDREVAHGLVDAAHGICPYLKATRGNSAAVCPYELRPAPHPAGQPSKLNGVCLIPRARSAAEAALPKDDPRRRFELLALPHLDAAYNLARWLTGNAEDAEDVVQEAYLRAYRFFDGFRGDNIRGWLLTIVRNYFHTWAKETRSPRLGFVAEMPEPDSAEDECTLWGAPQADPETLLLRDIDLATVRQVMQRLPSAYRKILLMREVEELSYHDLASITGLKIGTVAARLSRAREALRRLWHGAVAEDDVASPPRRHAATSPTRSPV